MQHLNSISKHAVTRPLWSVQDDIQACRTLHQAVTRALIVLSPSLTSSEDASIDDDAARASRIDPLATQRLLDILHDLSGRFERSLIQADWESELENAIVEAAARLEPLATQTRQTG